MRVWNYSAGAGVDYNAYFNNPIVSSENSGDTFNDTVAIYLINPNDNMSPEWQTLYFGCSTCAVASADSDGDGLSNQQEFWLGTNPTNKLSTFVLDDALRDAYEYNNIRWTSVGGKSYDIEYCDDLSGGAVFNHIITVEESSVANGVATNRIFQDTVTTPSTTGLRIYRVKLHQ